LDKLLKFAAASEQVSESSSQNSFNIENYNFTNITSLQ